MLQWHTSRLLYLAVCRSKTQNIKPHMWHGCRQQKEAWRGGWKDRHDGSMEAQIGQGPVVLLVMQTDVWLFASAFTVNIKQKEKQRSRQQWADDPTSEKTRQIETYRAAIARKEYLDMHSQDGWLKDLTCSKKHHIFRKMPKNDYFL